MSKLRTPEQLKQLFQQTKEKKEKELQLKRDEKKRQYQQLCKQADQLLKEAQERSKKEKVEQLSTLTKKTPQKPLKRFYINLFNNRCPKHINWKKWDEVVEQGRQKIRDMGIELKPSRDYVNYASPNRKISIMAYDLCDNPIGTYKSIPEASIALNIKIGTVINTVYNRPDHICLKHQVKLIRKKI